MDFRADSPKGHRNGGFLHYRANVSIVLLSGVLCLGGSTHALPLNLPETGNSTAARGKSTSEYARLVAKLRSLGASVRSTTEKVRQPFFSISGRIMKVNNEAIQVFEYSNPATLQTDAKRVSPDGKTVGNTKPLWMSTPHFFKNQRLIVIYVGDDQDVLRILKAALGTQFAGG